MVSIFGYKVTNPGAIARGGSRGFTNKTDVKRVAKADNKEFNKDVGTQKDKAVASGEATGGAYVYKGKGAANKGDYRINYSSGVRAEAEELGVDLPAGGYQGNRSTVAASVTAFNKEMETKRAAKAEAEAEVAVEDDTSLSTEDLDADDGIGSVAETMEGVEAAADTTVTSVDAGGNTSDGSELTDEQQEQITAIATAADTSGAEQAAAATGSYEAVASGVSGDAGFTAGGVDNDSFTGSAAGGAAEADIAEVISESEEEDEAIDSYRQGRRSTIATSAQGLLSSAPTRPTRSLMGGMIR